MEEAFFSHRFFDVDQEVGAGIPISEIEKCSVWPLKNALQQLGQKMKNFKSAVEAVKSRKNHSKYGLSTDEAIAIYLYTIQEENSTQTFAFQLNKLLRSSNFEEISNWVPYIKLLLSGVKKLPVVNGRVWRFSNSSISHQNSSHRTWFGFTSCTDNKSKVESLISRGKIRTLIQIQCINGRRIREFSSNPSEDEVLLIPGIALYTKSQSMLRPEIYFVSVQEMQYERHLSSGTNIAPIDRADHRVSPGLYKSVEDMSTTQDQDCAKDYFAADVTSRGEILLKLKYQPVAYSFSDAIQKLTNSINAIDKMARRAETRTRHLAKDLTLNEAASVCLYTMERSNQYTNVAAQLNQACRSSNHDLLTNWIPYIRLLLKGLTKLERSSGEIWRFGNRALPEKFAIDCVWYGCQMYTGNLKELAKNAKKNNASFIYIIDCVSMISIGELSSTANDDEVLLMPGTVLQVHKQQTCKNGVIAVWLQEKENKKNPASNQQNAVSLNSRTGPQPQHLDTSQGITLNVTFSGRFFDADLELNSGTLFPLCKQSSVSSLRDAIQNLRRWVDKIEEMEMMAEKQMAHPRHGLSIDEAAAIYLYTIQRENIEHTIPFQLNRVLRNPNNVPRLKMWTPYIDLLLSGLKKLAPQAVTVWRFSRKTIYSQPHFLWFGFNSCTSEKSICRSVLNDSDTRTIMVIKSAKAISIRDFSNNPDQNEFVLLPGTFLKMTNNQELDNGKVLISLEEPMIYPPEIQQNPVHSTDSPIFPADQLPSKPVGEELQPRKPTGTSEKDWLELRHPSNHKNSPMNFNDRQVLMKDPPAEVDRKILDRVYGSMMGMTLGDALGAHVEFRPHEYLLLYPVKDLEGGGTWGLTKGKFTDDTSMALCLAASLISCRGFVPYDQLVRYKWWYREGYMSSTGECFDIGASTSDSLHVFEQRQRSFGQTSNIPEDQIDKISDKHLLGQFNTECSYDGVAGNGALMRLAPVPLFFYKYPKFAVEYSGVSGRITHGDRKSYDACRYYGALIVAALQGASKDELLNNDFCKMHRSWFGEKELVKEVMEISEGSYKKKGGYGEGIRGKGYIINALEAALWAFWSDEDSFRKGALNAVNLGDDADTTAAIYGQLAGAYYGYDKLPKDWVEHIYASPFIECLSKWIVYEADQWHPMSGHVNVKDSNKETEANKPTIPKVPSSSTVVSHTKQVHTSTLNIPRTPLSATTSVPYEAMNLPVKGNSGRKIGGAPLARIESIQVSTTAERDAYDPSRYNSSTQKRFGNNLSVSPSAYPQEQISNHSVSPELRARTSAATQPSYHNSRTLTSKSSYVDNPYSGKKF